MFSKIKTYLYEPKSKIGLVHGILTILGSFLLSYLTMMVYTKFIPGDYAIKIMPSIILTPLVISIYAMWILFSKKMILAINKIIVISILCLLLLKVF